MRSKLLSLSVLLLAGLLSVHQPQVHAQAGPGSISSGDASIEQCLEEPIRVNLRGDQLVTETVNGQNQVVVNWSLLGGDDPNLGQKVEVFMDYLDRDPSIGESQNSLRAAFANHAYKELSQAKNQEVLDAFHQALSETVQQSQILKNRGIDSLFADYYPYIFIDQLKNNDELSQAFLTGVKNALNQESISQRDFIQKIGSSLKRVQGYGQIQSTASCVSRVFGVATLDQLIPGMPESLYGSRDAVMQRQLDVIRSDGKVGASLDAIFNDAELISQSRSAAEVGINSLFNVWMANDNVKELIRLYENDANVRLLVDDFYDSAFGREVDECVRNSYRPDLLEVTQEVYLDMVQPELASKSVYDEATANAMIEVMMSMLTDTRNKVVSDAASYITQSFINDYLTLEEAVATISSAKTPFTKYYEGRLSPYYGDVEGLLVEIYRDGTLIHTEKNTNITQFVDDDLPKNKLNQLVTYTYQIKTRTKCDDASGGPSSVSTIFISDGRPTEVSADLQIRLKESQNRFFMDRLNLLFEGLKAGQNELNGQKNAADSQKITQCNTSRSALIIDKESKKSSEKLFQYVLDCFGDADVNDTLQDQMKDIVTPLFRFLEISQNTNMDEMTENFLAPILEVAKKEHEARQQILEQVKPLKSHVQALANVTSIDDFTAEQKQLIKCGGHQSCPEAVQVLMEQYLLGASHAANVTVDVYDESGQLVLTQAGRTDIFGEIDSFELGQLFSGVNYEVKVRLADEPYALPKVSQVRITSALPIGQGKLSSEISLKSKIPYFFGNFDNSDDEITLKDIEMWSKLINQDPKKWANYNVDGFTGVDLFDVQLLQVNWGMQAQDEIPLESVSKNELLAIFGIKETDGAHAVGDSDHDGLNNGGEYLTKNKLNHTPQWLIKLK